MPSMDVVSELEMFEVNHAVANTVKEIATRFDFRGSKVEVELKEKDKIIKLRAESDFQVDQVRAMLENHPPPGAAPVGRWTSRARSAPPRAAAVCRWCRVR